MDATQNCDHAVGEGDKTDYGNSYEEITIQSPREVDHFFPRVPCNLCTKHVIKGVMKGKLPS